MTQELLTDMNLKLKMADYNLQRLLDSGEFHIDLPKGKSEPIQMYAGVPVCFKINSPDFFFPLTIRFTYIQAKDPEIHAYASNETLVPHAEIC